MRSMFTGRLFVAMLAMFAALLVVVEDVEARRMGGGRSVGRQYDRSSQREATPPARNPQQGAQPTPGNRFGGMLGGLAAGLGIAWLLSHFGLSGAFAEALGSILLLGGLAFLALFLARRFGLLGTPRPASPAYAGATNGAGSAGRAFEPPAQRAPQERRGFTSHSEPTLVTQAATGDAVSVTGHPLPPVGGTGSGLAGPLSAADMRGDIPDDFDVESFVQAATEQFVRLQSAWDAGDLASLRDFTTPELYADLKADITARGGRPNHTEVVSLSAEVLGVRDIGSAVMASLRYAGVMREDGAEAAPFEEVWHLVRSKRGRDGWLLAGIQQTSSPDGTEPWGRSANRH
jgi:predicted lipid-binding transport protein (Tim44 family)